MRVLRSLFIPLLLITLAGICAAQLTPEERAAVLIAQRYDVKPNIVYSTANNSQLKLDVYRPHDAKAPTPVVMVIHGGGWVAGTKEDRVLEGLPYLQMGFAIVNVEYRLGEVSLAPAAVEDCLCALHWVAKNAQKYNFDVDKIVTAGGSAGGHLALTTGMIPSSAGLDAECAAENTGWGTPNMEPLPKVAAIVNWFGITDVADMLQGPDTRSYVVAWFGSLPNRMEIARRVSPITYVRAGVPPVVTIHGDADPLVPYSSQAVRLHQALEKAGVRNQLLTIPGAGHGGFSGDQMLQGYEAIKSFLASVGITPVGK